MDSTLGTYFGRLGYAGARRLLLATGLVLLLIIAAVMYVRRVDAAEVGATLLFVPVFVAFVFWGLKGGVTAGVLAALGYAALRYPAVDAVGAGRFAGLIASRTIAFLAFGTIGGWATKQLETSLTKLELYDQIDDLTGLYNARFFVQDVDLEMQRSTRYQTIFSISLFDVPGSSLDPLPRRRRLAVVKELARLLRDSVRNVDRAAHGSDPTRHRFAVVLPETGPEGARIFTDRLVERVAAFLGEREVTVPAEGLHSLALTFPGDDDSIRTLKDEFDAIDQVEHPEGHQAASTGGSAG